VVLSVVVELVVSVESANATAIGTLTNRIAIPKDKAAVFNEDFMMRSPLLLR
jgi:hypothetical protein